MTNPLIYISGVMTYTFRFVALIACLVPAGAFAAQFTDDFSANTTGSYGTYDTVTSGGFGRFIYNAAGSRAQILTGDNVGMGITHTLPSSTTGDMQLDFLPTKKYPAGGAITLRLVQDANNYYELSSTDGYNPGIIRKVVNGVVVGSKLFQTGYSQNQNYRIIFTFTSGLLSANAFGQSLTVSGNTTPLLVSSFELELYQQDAYIDNIAYTTDGSVPSIAPVANAGPNQTVLEGATVTLNGSGSSDSDGSIVSYQWVQTAGTPTVSLNVANPQRPTFTAPMVAGASGVFTFRLTVTDDDGLTGTDLVDITVQPAGGSNTFLDDFSTPDTIGSYGTYDTVTNGGFGRFIYNAAGSRAQILTGDNVGMGITHTLPSSTTGDMQLDFLPTKKYPAGGAITLRLVQDANNYYELSSTDGYNPGIIRKVVNGVVVGSKLFQTGYSQNQNYRIIFTFTSGLLSANAFGQSLTVSGNTTPLLVSSFELELYQQDAYIDNIAYTTDGSVPSIAPVANAGPNQTVLEGATVTLNGSGSSDSDGSIVSYQWAQTAGTPTVSLNVANPQRPTFTAPLVAGASGVFTFRLTVTDNAGLTGTDLVDITVNSDTGTPPVANAGPNQTVLEGATVTLNGSGSSDADGSIVSYQWVQTSGTPTVNLNVTNPQRPTFTAPLVAGASGVFTFRLTVTDDDGLTGTDLVDITVQPAGGSDTFFDDFSDNTIVSYGTYDTVTSGGFGRLVYTGSRAQILTGDNVGMGINHTLPSSTTGDMQLDFLPTKKYPAGGAITLRLVQDANNYYELSSTDGYNPGIIRKVVNGVVVGSKLFQTGYSQNQNYRIKFTFTSDLLSANAFGQSLTVSGDTTPLLVSSFELELYQQDAYIDNIAYTTDGSVPSVAPVANAGPNQTVLEGATVTLNGSGSSDSDGSIVSYQWVQTAGTPTVTLNDANPQRPFFTAPMVAGASGVFTFRLTVTDDDGLTGTDLVSISVLPAGSSSELFDDFSANTISNYTTVDTWTAGGTGEFFHDTKTMRARLLTGDNVAMRVSRSLPLSSSGVFQLDFQPTVKYPAGGAFTLRLVQDADNYYELASTDGYGAGYMYKIVNGEVVDGKSLATGYKQKVNYHIAITFSPTTASVDAFGQTLTLSGSDTTAINVLGLEIELSQQDAYIDNIAYPNPLAFDYYLAIGDSITRGSNDDIAADGIGYPQILEELLTQSLGRLNLVLNEGVGGDTSLDGLLVLPSLLAGHPNATYVLVQFGSNDAFRQVPSGRFLQPGNPGYANSFKDHMQRMINLILNAGKIPYLAKVPPMLPPFDINTFNPYIRQYNDVVDELVARNSISVTPPDFYCYFDANPAELSDSLHPNGAGYQGMADLWLTALLSLGPGCIP